MTNDINNFLQSMVEAKRALDNEPVLLATIREHEGHIHRLGETVANRELHIHNLKQSEVTLTRKIREVEAERDETFRLAAEEGDKATAMLALLRQHVQQSLQTIAAVSGGEALAVVPDSERTELLTLRFAKQVDKDTIDLLSAQRDKALAEGEVQTQAIDDLRRELALAQMQMVYHTPMEPHHPFVPEPSSLQSEATGSSIGETSSSQGSGDTPNYMVQSASPSNALAGEQVVLDESGFTAGFGVAEVGQREVDPISSSGSQSAASADTSEAGSYHASATSPKESVSVPSDPTVSSSSSEGLPIAGEGALGNANGPTTDRVALGPNPSRS